MAQWWKENTVYVLSHQDATVCSVPARLLAYCMSKSPVNAVWAPQRPKWDHYFLTDTLHRHEYVTVADAWLVKAVYSSHTLATYIVLTMFFVFFPLQLLQHEMLEDKVMKGDCWQCWGTKWCKWKQLSQSTSYNVKKTHIQRNNSGGLVVILN